MERSRVLTSVGFNNGQMETNATYYHHLKTLKNAGSRNNWPNALSWNNFVLVARLSPDD